MKIELLCVGKTSEKYLIEGIQKYLKRLSHYISFEIKELPEIKNKKNWSPTQIKEAEGKKILQSIQPGNYVVLLDEKGRSKTSVQLAEFIEKRTFINTKKVVFIIGGAFGFSDSVYEASNELLSFSAMTFSHQMIRLFFVEQLYRAMTILRNEPYHNE